MTNGIEDKIPENIKFITAKVTVDKLSHHFDTNGESSQSDTIIDKIHSEFRGMANYFDVKINGDEAKIIWGREKAGEDAEILNKQALQLAKQRNFQEAIQHWRKAILINKFDPDFYFNLGLAYFEMKNYTKGLDHCLETVKLCPIYYRAHFLLGSIYAKSRKFQDAVNHLHAGLLFQPQNVMGLVNLGAVLSILKKNDEAIASFEKAIALSPKEIRAYLGLGKLYSSINDRANANRCYKIVTHLDPNGKYGEIARNSMMQQEDSLEENDTSKVDQDEEQLEQLLTLGYEAFLNCEYEQAEGIYSTYLKQKSKESNVWSLLATCQIRLGKKNDAIESMNRAIEIKPKSGKLQKQASIIYYACDQFEDAGKSAKSAIQLGKSDSVTLALLGISELKKNNYQESAKYLQQAVNLNPNNLMARFHFAISLIEIGQREAAKQHLEEILWAETITPLKEKAKKHLNDMMQNKT